MLKKLFKLLIATFILSTGVFSTAHGYNFTSNAEQEHAEQLAQKMQEHNSYSTNSCVTALVEWRPEHEQILTYVIDKMNVKSRHECAEMIFNDRPDLKSKIANHRISFISQFIPEKKITIKSSPDHLIVMEAQRTNPDLVVLQSLAMYEGASANAVEKMFLILKNKKSSNELLSNSLIFQAVRETVCTTRIDLTSCNTA